MKVEQKPFPAMAERRADGVPPWGVHVCELDALAPPDPDDNGPFAVAYREAAALRERIESGQ